MTLGDVVPAIESTVSGAVAGFVPVVPTCGADAVVGAGSVATHCTGPASDPNYLYRYVDGTLTVGRAVVTVQASSPAMTLGDVVPAIESTVSGAVAGFVPVVPTCGADAVVGAGSVATHCTGPASDANYLYRYVDGALTVERAAVTVQASSPTMVLGDPVPAIGYTVAGAVAGEPVTPPDCSAPSIAGPGVYPTDCTGPASDANYDYTYLAGSLSVGGAHLTVVAESSTIAATAAIPTISYTVIGARVDGTAPATPTCAAVVPPQAARGVYPTRCTGPTADEVYDYTYVDGTLSLGSVTVTASDRSSTLGDPLGAVGFSVVGDDPAAPIAPPDCSVVAPAEPVVGTYPTRCSGPASDADYDYTYVDGTLTVGRATATVQASSPSMTLGEPVPAISATISGAVAGFPTVDPTCGADPVPTAGSVATHCAGPLSDASYDYRYVDGTLTVGRATVTVQASSPTMTFGDPVPPVTSTVVGAVPGHPISPPNCSAPAPEIVGSSTTTCQGVVSDASYTYVYVPGTLTAAPRPVEIRAGGGSVPLGGPVGAIGYTTDGGEVAGVPITALTCSVDPVAGGGTYATTCTGPDEDFHYRYTYVPGVLTVQRATVTVVAASASITFGNPVPAVGATVHGVVAGFDPAPLGCVAEATGLPIPGSYPTSCAGPAADANYVYQRTPGTLTVLPAVVTVTASSPTITVGEPAPAISAGTSGTVAGTPSAAPSCTVPPPTGAGTYATSCTGPAADAFYTYAYRNGVLTVQRAQTTVALFTNVASPPSGQAVTLQATVAVVAPGRAPFTSPVQFFDGSTLLGSAAIVNGQATLTMSTLAIGSHTITASYREDSDLQGSSSAPVQVNVVKASTAMAISASATSASYGQALTLTATISVVAPGTGAPGSSVVFSDGSTQLAVVASSGGRATLVTSALSVGTHTLTASYLEGAKFYGSIERAVDGDGGSGGDGHDPEPLADRAARRPVGHAHRHGHRRRPRRRRARRVDLVLRRVGVPRRGGPDERDGQPHDHPLERSALVQCPLRRRRELRPEHEPVDLGELMASATVLKVGPGASRQPGPSERRGQLEDQGARIFSASSSGLAWGRHGGAIRATPAEKKSRARTWASRRG